mmetsp:Transcript_7747/g.31071  ORF Transcript_7747/g.31071 Transcript_7747/m.31071 type:complete len:201 (-) Transcript_7747:3124-3726(-)
MMRLGTRRRNFVGTMLPNPGSRRTSWFAPRLAKPMYTRKPESEAIGMCPNVERKHTTTMNVITCAAKFVTRVSVAPCTRERMIPCRLLSTELPSSFACRCECGRAGTLGGSPKHAVATVKPPIRNMSQLNAVPLRSLFSGLATSMAQIFVSRMICTANINAGTRASAQCCALKAKSTAVGQRGKCSAAAFTRSTATFGKA